MKRRTKIGVPADFKRVIPDHGKPGDTGGGAVLLGLQVQAMLQGEAGVGATDYNLQSKALIGSNNIIFLSSVFICINIKQPIDYQSQTNNI